MTPDELVAAACPKIRDLGFAYYFVPETLAKGDALGLDLFHFYVLGRGGVLGDVESGVVASAMLPAIRTVAARTEGRDFMAFSTH